uniref:NADH dehydrogenase subunit 6 n=1 Tax=Epiverta chelonia TaxID=1518448 RepID=UPI0020795FFC|nr:NADH dehydrogenase subunit 6 [Epiverta chelonia]URN72942.1 NADH dehydrogenase subunit 6 [Epiverta chelonia]
MLFFMLIMIISCMIIFLNHPFSLGMTILIQSILISLTIGTMNFNFWYSYILMLIMIGGLLILFIYMTSIASNEKFKINFLIFLIFSLIISSTMMIWMAKNCHLNEFLYKNFLIFKMNNNYNFNYSLSKFLNYPSLKILLITIFYLLITMIASVKICKIKLGPLRQMF